MVKHMAIQMLWLQDLVRRGAVEMKRVRGDVNAADLMTKFLSRSKIDAHVQCLRFRTRDTYHELKRGPTGRRPSSARHLGCVFQDMKPPKSILRKSTHMQKPIQRVKFTKAVARHAKNRDQNPSLGIICPGDPQQRNPNAPKFEDRSQE